MASTATMDEGLAKIRAHANGNQRGPATLLAAIDRTLEQSNAGQKTPTAYLAALVSTLRSVSAQVGEDRELEVNVLALLAVVAPNVPPAVLRQEHSRVIEVVAPSLDFYSTSAHASQQPALKSIINILAPVYRALPAADLSNPATKRLFLSGLLPLVGAPQPKLRRTAQTLVGGLLSSPPAPSVTHPYARYAGAFVVEQLERLLATAKSSRRGAIAAEGSSEAAGAIGLLGFVRQIGKDFPGSHVSPLISILLSLPGLGNPFLASSAYGVLESLFSHSSDSFEAGKVESTLLAVLAEKPDDRDERLLPGWLEAVEHGWVALARVDAEACRKELAVDDRIGGVLALVGSASPLLRKPAASCASAICRYALADEDILKAVSAAEASAKGKKTGTTPDSAVTQMLDGLFEALSSIRHAPASVPAFLIVLSALVSRLRLRPSSASAVRPPPAAGALLKPHINLVGDLRGEPTFEYREAADAVLGVASQVCGPEWLLSLLPLNVEESLSSSSSQQGRGWLLPLLRDGKITNARLGHFVEAMVPLSEKLFERRKKALADGGKRNVEAKVCEALTEQVWGLFPGYCDLPWDLPVAFTQKFAELLSSVLYTQPSLRPSVCRGLQLLVERNRSLSDSGAPPEESVRSFGLTPEDATKNVQLLGKLAPNLLAVLFNVYAKAASNAKGFVLECISAYLSVLSQKDLAATCQQVRKLLEQALKAKSKGGKPATTSEDSDPAHTMLDLLIALVPFADPSTASSLFDLALSDLLFARKDDPGTQKKAYRILARLAESKKAEGVVVGKLDVLVPKLVATSGSAAAGAKKDRCFLLLALLPVLPSSQLHYIPSLLPEVVLGTKEHNRESREASYDLLAKMGKRMAAGGVVDRALVAGSGDEMSTEAPATISEFFTMVSAGLVGTSPHMISASIAALSRILFEFSNDLSVETVDDLIATINVFLGSANAEIVKSAIGFVKVSIVCLPTSTIEKHLSDLVPNLLRWSREHKNHFKLNIRHIFERLVRKYGAERIATLVGEDDRKLVTNIRKRQQRAKRGKANDEGGASEDEEEPGARREGDAFEQALYGSDSEDEGDADEEMRLEEGDEVMDLLDPKMASRITTGKLSKSDKRRQKLAADAAAYKTEDDTGRLIVEDEDAAPPKAGAEDSTNAYLDAVNSGFKRTAKGGLKAKRVRDEEEAVEEVEDAMAGIKVTDDKKEKKRKVGKEKLGGEFKAKKAGGDVSKGGQQPYAYLSLSTAGRKGKEAKKFDITGKKRGSRR